MGQWRPSVRPTGGVGRPAPSESTYPPPNVAHILLAMIDPIYATELAVTDSCAAHLLPKAICPSSRTIPSNRSFDNEFGRHNDHHLVRFISNHLNNEKDVEIDVLDPNGQNRCVTTFRNLKTTTKQDPPSGLRQGSFEIQFPTKTSDEWREKHLNAGKLVKMHIVEPEYHRIELSMLHSGFLTLCYHFGTTELDCEGTQFVRHVLQNSISEVLDSNIVEYCQVLTLVRRGLLISGQVRTINDAVQKALDSDPHPILIVRLEQDCCLMPALPYHERFKSVAFLPGLEHNSLTQWKSVISRLSQSYTVPMLVGILTPFTLSTSPALAYHEMAEALRQCN